MPTAAVRAERRARGLCVECPTPSKTARCPVCKDRENRRRSARRHGSGVQIFSVRGAPSRTPLRRAA